MTQLTLLPLDLTGNAAANTVTGESHTLIRVPNKQHRLLQLDRGLYYTGSLKLYDASGNRIAASDYTTAYLYRELTELTGKEICGFVVITNTTVSDSITATYQALGGPYSLSINDLKAVLTAADPTTLTATWGEVTDKPTEYNPAAHTNEFWQVYSYNDLITELNDIASAIRTGHTGMYNELSNYVNYEVGQVKSYIDALNAGITEHVNDFSNPHLVTATQVGLGSVANLAFATNPEAIAGSSNDLYISPAGAYQHLNATALAALRNHVSDFNNPHRTTAEQIGAYDVASILAALSGKYSKTDRVANSTLFGGYNVTEFLNYAKHNLPAENITSGVLNPARFTQGSAPSNTGYVLSGNLTWRSIASIFASLGIDISVTRVTAVGWIGDPADAITYLNTNYTDLALYPVGSYIVTQYRDYQVISAGGTTRRSYFTDFNIAQRGASGWSFFTLPT